MLATTKFPAEQESRIEWWGRVILRQEGGRIPLAQFCRQLGITTRKVLLLEAASSKTGCRWLR